MTAFFIGTITFPIANIYYISERQRATVYYFI
uniref:Uncharacterized protein n=1 Tax=Myoviridae sp. ctJ2i1 TaxID=2825079 RepID=A0A8S5V206_9CAUD|nr:MAG TPA: hypothetical protein [Myoviridae sp. ctJ2i1]